MGGERQECAGLAPGPMAVALAIPTTQTQTSAVNKKPGDMAATAKSHSCPNCGTQVLLDTALEDAQRKIAELQAQVEMLKEKATAAGMYFHLSCYLSFGFV